MDDYWRLSMGGRWLLGVREVGINSHRGGRLMGELGGGWGTSVTFLLVLFCKGVEQRERKGLEGSGGPAWTGRCQGGPRDAEAHGQGSRPRPGSAVGPRLLCKWGVTGQGCPWAGLGVCPLRRRCTEQGAGLLEEEVIHMLPTWFRGSRSDSAFSLGGGPRPTFLFRADAGRVWRPHLPSTCSLWGEGER